MPPSVHRPPPLEIRPDCDPASAHSQQPSQSAANTRVCANECTQFARMAVHFAPLFVISIAAEQLALSVFCASPSMPSFLVCYRTL